MAEGRGGETREVAEAVTSVGFHFGANQMFVHNYNLVFGSRRYLPIHINNFKTCRRPCVISRSATCVRCCGL